MSNTLDPYVYSGKARYSEGRDPLMKYTRENSLRLTPVQEKLIEETMKHPRSRMLSSEDEMQFLQNLVKSIGAKKTIDIGVYTGYSALTIALGLPEDGQVFAFDINDDFANIGKPFWQEAGVDKKIILTIGPALESLEKIIKKKENLGTFDFAFIDADKLNYDNYYEACLKLLCPGGIIALDNMLWSGQVVDSNDNSAETVAFRNLAKKLHADDRVNVSFLSIGDGTYLAFKR